MPTECVPPRFSRGRGTRPTRKVARLRTVSRAVAASAESATSVATLPTWLSVETRRLGFERGEQLRAILDANDPGRRGG